MKKYDIYTSIFAVVHCVSVRDRVPFHHFHLFTRVLFYERSTNKKVMGFDDIYNTLGRIE